MPRLLHVLPAFLIIVTSLIIFTHLSYPQPTANDQQLTTNQWPTYTHPTQDFEFKYPASWKTHVDEYISFKYPSTWIVQPTYIYGTESETAFSYNYNQATGKAYSSLDEYLGPKANWASDITVNNHPVKYIENQGGDHAIAYKEIVGFSKNNSLIISLYFQPPYFKSPLSFSLSLPTIKFLD